LTTTDQVCATCTTAITVTSRNPTKRYCSPRCRVADWHRHHDRPALSTMENQNQRNDVPKPNPESGDAIPDAGTAYANSANGVPYGANAANGEQRCPHCRAAIAVIAILVPPTAAHVRTPEVTKPPT
jgi:endogenous inhibitor of DNA gyrase (YacG/DUF329 family)